MSTDGVGELRARPSYNAAVMTAGAAVAAVASMMLVIDSFILASAPKTVLGCDVSPRLSCGAVASSGWSTLLHVRGIGIPNALIGVLMFPVAIGFGVALISGLRPRKPLRILLAAGIVAADAGAVLLLVISATVIGVLCPWCLTMDAGVLAMTIGCVRWLAVTGGGPATMTRSWASLALEAALAASLAVAAITASSM